jgi:hypothetical protein
MIKIIEIILNSRMSDHIENRAKRIGELLNIVNSWNTREFYRNKFRDNSSAEFYSTIIIKLKEIYDDAIFAKDKTQNTITDFEEKQARYQETINGKNNVLDMGQKLIKQMSEPLEILYLSDIGLGDKVLVRKK